MPPQETVLNPKSQLAIQTLRPILKAAGQPEPDMHRITITESSLAEFSQYDGLTSAILAHDMPEITGSVVLDHYTDGAGYKGIMATQELRLSPVTYRLPHGELAKFALEHGLHGYVDESGVSKPLLKEAASDLFYTSFTCPVPCNHLWNVFGASGNGYRLRFEVTPGAAQLRAMRYHSGPTLLKQVNDALVQAGLPRFILKGMSRVGAFYLPMNLETENEIRLLAKRFHSGGAPVVTSGQSEYWPVPIGTVNATACLKLLQIGVRKLDLKIVSTKLPAWCTEVAIVAD